MSISLSNYIDVTSVVGGTANVAVRAQDGLVVTGNALVPTGGFLSFASAPDVGDYFGTGSEEYARAEFYFGWVSKAGRQPQALDFWFWNNDAATASKIFGKPMTFSLSTFTSITTGDFTLTLGGFTHHLTAIDCSGDANLAAVAATVQVAIRAFSGGGAAWTGATVSFDAQRGCFDLVSGTTGADTVSVTAGTTTDLAGPLGWLTGAILSNGTTAQDIPTNLNILYNQTNNFGSFCYSTALALSLSNVEAAATWNNSLTPNVQFMYSISVTASNASAWVAGLAGISGWTMTLSPLSTEYPEMVPMMIMSATDYNAINSVQNYEFQKDFDLTPSVASDQDYNTYKALAINFYGQTQTAGQQISFYQEGVMGGGNDNSPSDQSLYANEMWLKSASTAALMNLLLALPQIPANNAGRAQILATLQSIIDQALSNGTISVGKPLSSTQKLFITNATGDTRAWQQVQNVGYWVGCVLATYVDGGITKWKATYTLIYSKDDTIRKILGTDILI